MNCLFVCADISYLPSLRMRVATPTALLSTTGSVVGRFAGEAS